MWGYSGLGFRYLMFGFEVVGGFRACRGLIVVGLGVWEGGGGCLGLGRVFARFGFCRLKVCCDCVV